jgi:hypothetical protein
MMDMKVLNAVAPRYYPVIAGLLEIALGFFGIYICLLQMVAIGGRLPPSPFIVGGLIASYLGLVGGLSSLLKRYHKLGILGAYAMFVWFGSLFCIQLISNIALSGAPFAANTFPSTSIEFIEYVAVFIILLLTPSFLSSILIRKSIAEFV